MAVLGFLLPWSQIIIGSSQVGGYFNTWGLASPTHVFVFIGLLVILGVEIIRVQVPAWLRTGIPGLVMGGLLVGGVWPYAVGPVSWTSAPWSSASVVWPSWSVGSPSPPGRPVSRQKNDRSSEGRRIGEGSGTGPCYKAPCEFRTGPDPIGGVG